MSTLALFFGGYMASPADVQSWANSAQALRKDVDFQAYPYPHGADWHAESAVSGAKDFIKQAIAAIKSSSADTIFIVGHSSGVAIADALDRQLKDHSKISLVALDGGPPGGKQGRRPSTQVWAATYDDTYFSKNYDSMKDSPRFHKYTATHKLTDEWSLHYSLVNESVDDGLAKKGSHKYAAGYAKCKANLAWL
jgi:hypothetical protein